MKLCIYCRYYTPHRETIWGDATRSYAACTFNGYPTDPVFGGQGGWAECTIVRYHEQFCGMEGKHWLAKRHPDMPYAGYEVVEHTTPWGWTGKIWVDSKDKHNWGYLTVADEAESNSKKREQIR